MSDHRGLWVYNIGNLDLGFQTVSNFYGRRPSTRVLSQEKYYSPKG